MYPSFYLKSSRKFTEQEIQWVQKGGTAGTTSLGQTTCGRTKFNLDL